MKEVTAGVSLETRKLRNADCNTRLPTLYFGAKGFESTIVFALFAACAARARHVVAVANFLPSTVAKFLLLDIAVLSSYMLLCAAASHFKRSLCACVFPCGLSIIAWRVPALHG